MQYVAERFALVVALIWVLSKDESRLVPFVVLCGIMAMLARCWECAS
jgi:hypothetical protein